MKKINFNVKINLILIIIIVLLGIVIYTKDKQIKEIVNTKYEFCYTINNEEICSQQRIEDYLNDLD